jgi:hypothetical protein
MICSVSEPQKASKLKGLKSFIQYNITPHNTRRTVTRRYKHFDWLHERLVEKFNFIPVAPLPDKVVTGELPTDYRCKDVRFPVISTCVTIPNPDSLSSSETRVNPGIRS